MKKWFCLLLCLALCLSAAACGAEAPASAPEEAPPSVDEGPAGAPPALAFDETAGTVNVAGLKGPTGMGLTYLMDAANGGQTVGEATAYDYAVTVSGDPTEVVAKVIAGEFDIACLPTNSAAAIWNKTGGQVQLLALNTLGVLQILQNTADGSAPVTGWADLAGRTIYATGQGANPEYALNYLLRQNGLEPGTDVTVEFCGTHDELVAKCVAGEAGVCMLPEPNATVVTLKAPDYQKVLALNDAWNATGSAMVMGCVVVQKAFAEAHPAVVADFLTAYEASVGWVLENQTQAAALMEQYGILPSQAIAEKALPDCALTCITGGEMQPALGPYYQVLFDADPASVGGAIPGAAFYYGG